MSLGLVSQILLKALLRIRVHLLFLFAPELPESSWACKRYAGPISLEPQPWSLMGRGEDVGFGIGWPPAAAQHSHVLPCSWWGHVPFPRQPSASGKIGMAELS